MLDAKLGYVMDFRDLEARQREVRQRYGSAFVAAPVNLKVGISENARHGVVQLNGLRHNPEGDMPLHVAHLRAWCPDALPFLGLAPGWRFLKAGEYVDVWFDRELEP
jgi:hypothetical protein